MILLIVIFALKKENPLLIKVALMMLLRMTLNA